MAYPQRQPQGRDEDSMIRAHLTPKQKAELFLKQKGCCAICGEKITGKVEYDHIQAIARGGSNHFTNFQALCVACHAAKTFGKRHCRLGADNFEAKKTARLARGKKEKKKTIKSRGFQEWRNFRGEIVRKES